MINNEVKNDAGELVGFRCSQCDEVKTKMWGTVCNACAAKKIPEVSRRSIYMKTCEMMYDHHTILNIVDIETALNIIKGVLQRNESKN